MEIIFSRISLLARKNDRYSNTLKYVFESKISIHACPQENLHSESSPSPHTELVAAAAQRNCRAPLRRLILLCGTPRSFPLGNRNFFTHLIAFLPDTSLSFWSGRSLVFQVAGLSPADKRCRRDGMGDLYLGREFSSPFASLPGQWAAPSHGREWPRQRPPLITLSVLLTFWGPLLKHWDLGCPSTPRPYCQIYSIVPGFGGATPRHQIFSFSLH